MGLHGTLGNDGGRFLHTHGVAYLTSPYAQVMVEGPYSFSSDVYSLALVLYELWVRRIPYEGLNQAQICYRVATRDERPDLNVSDSAQGGSVGPPERVAALIK